MRSTCVPLGAFWLSFIISVKADVVITPAQKSANDVQEKPKYIMAESHE